MCVCVCVCGCGCVCVCVCVCRCSPLYVHMCTGEHLTETELVEYLMTLLGATSNPEVEGAFTAEPGDVLAEIPNTLTATLFAEELLGLAT